MEDEEENDDEEDDEEEEDEEEDDDDVDDDDDDKVESEDGERGERGPVEDPADGEGHTTPLLRAPPPLPLSSARETKYSSSINLFRTREEIPPSFETSSRTFAFL